MKKLSAVVFGVALLLVSATSSFAGLVWSAYPTTFTDKPAGTVWDSGVLNLTPAQMGPVNNLTLTVQLSTVGLNSFMPVLAVQGTDPGSPGGSWYPIGPTGKWTATFTNVPYELSGVYQFKLSAASFGGLGGTWSLSSVELSNPAKTPIPAAALLLGSGVVGLMGVGRTLRKKYQA